MMSLINHEPIQVNYEAKCKTDYGIEGESCLQISTAKRVLLIEDSEDWRIYFEAILTEKIFVPIKVFHCQLGLKAADVCLCIEPDLIIINISKPTMEGIKTAKQIWRLCSHVSILFWTQHHRESHLRELANILPDQAVHGYVIKTESDDKLVNAIQCLLLYGSPYIDPMATSFPSANMYEGTVVGGTDMEILHGLASGLTEVAIARRHYISVRGVRRLIELLSAKLLNDKEHASVSDTGFEVYNQRDRLVFESLRCGLINLQDLELIDLKIRNWLQAKQEEQNLLA